MFIRPLIAPLLSGALLAASPAPLLAQASDGLLIKTDDLNLESEAGRATLERRITGAQSQLCRNATATGSRSRAAQEQKACKAEVRRQVAAQFPSAERKG